MPEKQEAVRAQRATLPKGMFDSRSLHVDIRVDDTRDKYVQHAKGVKQKHIPKSRNG